MEGRRAPALRPEKAAPEKVQVLELFRSEAARLSACAEAFRAAARSSPAAPGRQRRWVAGLALAAVLGLVTWAASRVGYASPVPDAPLLIVSFKHPGKAAEGCREPTADELKNLPKHMRAKQICERRRIAVRLRVTVDGREQLARSYPPRGVWGDGNSIAVERIPLPPGRHDVRVELGDTPDTAELNHSTSRQVTLTERHNTVLVFDKLEGFQWYE